MMSVINSTKYYFFRKGRQIYYELKMDALGRKEDEGRNWLR